MHPRILHLLPDLVAHDVDLLARVPEHAGEEGVGEGLEALHDLQVVPGADFFLAKNKRKTRDPVSKYPNLFADCIILRNVLLCSHTYQMFVRRPCPHRPHVLLRPDVREPGLLHQRFEQGSRARFQAALSRRHEEDLVEVF